MARHRFFYLLNLARHHVFKAAERAAQAELGVSAAQLGALTAIAAGPDLSQRELARTLGYNESAITALLRRMIDAELVERVASEDDRRVQRIRLTTRGADVVRRSKRVLARFNATLMDGFDEAELDVAARFLSSAIERFGSEER